MKRRTSSTILSISYPKLKIAMLITATSLSFAILALSPGLHAAPTPVNTTTTSTTSTGSASSSSASATGSVLNFIIRGGEAGVMETLPGDITFTEYCRLFYKNFTVPTGDSRMAPSKTILPLGWGGFNMYFDYDLQISDCAMDPNYIAHQGVFWWCSGETCTDTVSFTSTETTQVRIGYKVGIGCKVSGKVGEIGLEVSLSAEQSSDWTNTRSITRTETKQLVLKRGDRCLPTTIMYKMMCSSVGKGTVILSNHMKSASDIAQITVIRDPRRIPELAAILAGYSDQLNATSCGRTEWSGRDTQDFCATWFQVFRYENRNTPISDSQKDCFWNQSETTR